MKKAGELLAEQAAAFNPAVGAAMTVRDVLASGGTEGSMGQYLIAGGGSRANDAATANAVLSAFNRLAGFKSRL